MNTAVRSYERGTSNAPPIDLAGIRTLKWTETYRFRSPQG